MIEFQKITVKRKVAEVFRICNSPDTVKAQSLTINNKVKVYWKYGGW